MAWEGFAEAIKPWQTLIGSSIAVAAAFVAALIAWKNVSRQISHSADLEIKRRARKHVALRATLPLTLGAISDYADRIAMTLHALLNPGPEGVQPRDAKSIQPENGAQFSGYLVQLNSGRQMPQFPGPPANTIEAPAEFIEYSDAIDVQLFEKLLSRVQILSARVSSISVPINSASFVTSGWIEMNIIEAASIYAGAAQAYD